MRTAVIDLGTNTFNLLIVETNGKGYDVISREKYPVKLGMGGINQSIITPEAFARGLSALKKYKQSIEFEGVEKVFAFATSAIRSADNGSDFVNTVRDQLGIEINVITGSKEAELIYLGVKQVVDLTSEKILILDIGGGSNEVIIADSEKIYWKKSFQLGIARVLEKFQPSDPITNNEINDLENYFNSELEELFQEASKYDVKTLIGSSGSFDTFASMISCRFQEDDAVKAKSNSFCVDLELYSFLHETLISSTLEERKNMQGLEQLRIEMIVLASILVNFLIKKLNIKVLIQSDYALKEGVIYEMINLK